MKPLLLLSILMQFPTSLPYDLTRPTLELADVIDIAASYELHHPTVPASTPWYGMTDYDNLKIYVISNADIANKRRTVVHEFIHAKRHMQGIPVNVAEEEAIVKQLADQLYYDLYGPK